MVKSISQGVGAFLQHYPRVAAVVTAQALGHENAMTVDWHTPLSLNPPLYGIAVAPQRFTYQLIAESKQFGLNFLPFEAMELVALVGSTGGWQINKFQSFNIDKEQPAKTTVPILKAAYAAYECRLVDDSAFGDHHLLVGEILAVHQLKEAFTPEEMLNPNRISPVLYLGNEFYLTADRETLREIL